MTVQIAVRLDERNVEYLDAEVAAGHGRSRAAYLNRLLAREARRKRALEDLERMQAAGPDPDMQGLADWTASRDYAYLSDLD